MLKRPNCLLNTVTGYNHKTGTVIAGTTFMLKDSNCGNQFYRGINLDVPSKQKCSLNRTLARAHVHKCHRNFIKYREVPKPNTARLMFKHHR